MKLLKKLAFVLTAALAIVPSVRGEELNLFAWSEYVPQSVLDGFQKETGIKVNYEQYDSNETMLSKLLSGAAKYDLIQPSEYVVEALAKDGKLMEIDHAKLPNLKNIDPDLMKLKHDPGLKYSVPWMTGTVGIVYNYQKIKDPITGFKDVFSGKYKQKIVALDDGREIVSWVLATQGKDINAISPESLAGAKDTMKDWMSQVKIFDSDSPKTPLQGGDVDIGIVWSGEGAILLREAGDRFKWVIPVEGTHRFVDSLAIPKDSPHADAAHKFINYVLQPEVSKLISDEFPYTNPNIEARKLLDEAALKNAASYPSGELKLEIFRDIGDAAKLVDELYTNLKSK